MYLWNVCHMPGTTIDPRNIFVNNTGEVHAPMKLTWERQTVKRTGD